MPLDAPILPCFHLICNPKYDIYTSKSTYQHRCTSFILSINTDKSSSISLKRFKRNIFINILKTLLTFSIEISSAGGENFPPSRDCNDTFYETYKCSRFLSKVQHCELSETLTYFKYLKTAKPNMNQVSSFFQGLSMCDAINAD